MSRRHNRQRRAARGARDRSHPRTELPSETFDSTVARWRYQRMLGEMQLRSGDRPFADRVWGPLVEVDSASPDLGGELRQKTEAVLLEQTAKQRPN
jgi:hypothetical protein